MRHLDRDQLTLLALGESPTPAGDAGTDRGRIDDHLAECPVCRGEYEALREVVTLGRESDPDDLDPPPPPTRVWDAIQHDLQTEPDADREPARLVPAARRPMRAAVLAVAACVAGVVVGVGATLGWQAIDKPATPTPTVLASTPLTPVTGTPAAAGSARLIRTGDRLELVVDARNLPLTDGYYEAWMFVPSTTRMQAMGTIRPGTQATFPVPDGLDPAGWRGIDISAESFDGDPSHSATSVLRGELRR